jgi:hypothetical protein
MIHGMEVVAVLLAIFGTGFAVGYGVRALISHRRRAQHRRDTEGLR